MHKATDSNLERGFRVFAPLGGIVLLVAGMSVLDLLIARLVTNRTDEMVEDAMRSIDLVHGLREKAALLAASDLSAERLRTLTRELEAYTRAYDPLAIYEGEHEEWGRLREALTRLRQDVESHNRGRVSARVNEVERSVGRLLTINRRAGARLSSEIRASQRHELSIDCVVGVLTILLIIAIWAARHRARIREQLLQAENLALIEERNRELDAFAARAAHDLRSPLSPIRGYADLIGESEEASADVRRMAGKIRLSVDRMARVVQNMLELARCGKPVAGRASVHDVCLAMLEELAPELHEVHCTTNVTQEPVALAPSAVEQILRNLIGNAIKYRSPQRALTITIRAEAAGRHVVLQVVDNGVGMDPESARHAFEPFFRARSDVAGYGLGLAIVERIARGAGGACELSSETDHGTTVTVRLPRA